MNTMQAFYTALLVSSVFLLPCAVMAADTPPEPIGGPALIVRDFVPQQGMCRAKRPITITAVIENPGESTVNVRTRLQGPHGMPIPRVDAPAEFALEARQSRLLSWVTEAEEPSYATYTLRVISNGAEIAPAYLDIRFFPAGPIQKLDYIPEPKPVKTSILVGAHNCPLWEKDKPQMWNQVRKHPERTPALGFYSQESPEVADWETKWAVEHGVSFFIYCWYRASQGEPVNMLYGSAIHDALFKSKFADKMKMTIMWENQHRGFAGVSDEKDLMDNLMPFWMENYFKKACYLKVDNKPVLFIYRPEFLVQDLGSVENVVKAFDKMRQACKNAGFDGLYILGEYRGLDVNHLKLLKQLGLDYTFAYVWPVPDSPPADKAVEIQMGHIKNTQALGILPQVVTVSQAWSGWSDEGSIWKIPPAKFEGLLRQAKDFIATFPASELGSKMLLLDNWNEWSEGHYLAPYREYGFGYLDAVRKVFSDAPEEHTDLIPEDIGLGPYDKAYTAWNDEQFKLRNLSVKKAQKAGPDEPGLVAWWAFDEDDASPVALDYSGHRLGGTLDKATRTKGIDGKALVCDGGTAAIPSTAALAPKSGFTLECWVKTDTPGQNDKWIISNRTATKGYGLGLIQGKPAFGIPKTAWGNNATATTPLALGRWVHLAGTYDNQVIRIYVDGKECGALDRGGALNSEALPLYLGSYAVGHDAHFTGLLDEVKLYDRVLTADELRAHARQ